MSLVDLGKKLLEAARAGQDDEVRILMANGAPFTTDWVKSDLNVIELLLFPPPLLLLSSSQIKVNLIFMLNHFFSP
jgi:hypothetical protein